MRTIFNRLKPSLHLSMVTSETFFLFQNVAFEIQTLSLIITSVDKCPTQ